jgi:transposase
MATIYRVTLTPEERNQLVTLTQTGRHASRTVNLGRALLLCDKSPEGPGWTTKEICEALGICDRTVERLKKRFVEDGMEQALERKPVGFGVRPFKFDGAIEANLIAMAHGEPPEGRARWTVRLLAEKAVELRVADSISPSSVHKILKKTNLSLTRRSTGRFRRKIARNS